MNESRASKVARIAILSVLIVFTATPLYVMLSTSVKPLSEVQREFTWIPRSITIQPFIDMWSTVHLADYFLNSLIVAGISSTLSVVIALVAGYATSRYVFRGRNLFSGVILSTQMIPGILFLLPLFLIFVSVDNFLGFELLYQTRFGLIIVFMTFTLPFSIYMFANYLNGIPRELDEAARMDGCGVFATLFKVIVPTAVPGIVAVWVYSFMLAWGEILFASQLTDNESATLAIGLQNYATQLDVYWNQIMAASLAVSLPVVIGFMLLQRYFVAGLTAGSVK
ncbi:carbohydrate ABC transporter permease [Microbacterium sp. E-13]|uniref:carbohydrate ABC transporter permease n=1 Tax=Microbacterium sp. E-13 TaxID=3404048 RepID=UPI003CED5908